MSTTGKGKGKKENFKGYPVARGQKERGLGLASEAGLEGKRVSVVLSEL